MIPAMWMRAVAGLLACVFALPACMTMMLWSPDHGIEDGWWGTLTEAAQFVRAGDGGPLLAIDSRHDHAADRLRPAGERRPWLLIEPVAHPQTLVRIESMFAGKDPPFSTSLQRSLATDGLPQHDDLLFWLSSTRAVPIPDGVWELEERHKHRAPYGNSHEIQVPCRLVWAEAPPGPLVAWPGNGLACAIGKPRRTSAGRRILLTPLAVLGDGVLLPLELLTILSWW